MIIGFPVLESLESLKEGSPYRFSDILIEFGLVELLITTPTNRSAKTPSCNFFGMELAPPRHINLARSMADKGPIWERIVEENGLQKFRFEEIAAWGYPDGVFASDYDIVSDTSKARRFGFHDLVDTEEMFLRMFSDFRRERIIP